jgi:hypothetical protein
MRRRRGCILCRETELSNHESCCILSWARPGRGEGTSGIILVEKHSHSLAT